MLRAVAAERHVVGKAHLPIAAAAVEFERGAGADGTAADDELAIGPERADFHHVAAERGIGELDEPRGAVVADIDAAAVGLDFAAIDADVAASGGELDRAARPWGRAGKEREKLAAVVDGDGGAGGFTAVEANAAALTAGATGGAVGHFDGRADIDRSAGDDVHAAAQPAGGRGHTVRTGRGGDGRSDIDVVRDRPRAGSEVHRAAIAARGRAGERSGSVGPNLIDAAGGDIHISGVDGERAASGTGRGGEVDSAADDYGARGERGRAGGGSRGESAADVERVAHADVTGFHISRDVDVVEAAERGAAGLDAARADIQKAGEREKIGRGLEARRGHLDARIGERLRESDAGARGELEHGGDRARIHHDRAGGVEDRLEGRDGRAARNRDALLGIHVETGHRRLDFAIERDRAGGSAGIDLHVFEAREKRGLDRVAERDRPIRRAEEKRAQRIHLPRAPDGAGGDAGPGDERDVGGAAGDGESGRSLEFEAREAIDRHAAAQRGAAAHYAESRVEAARRIEGRRRVEKIRGRGTADCCGLIQTARVHDAVSGDPLRGRGDRRLVGDEVRIRDGDEGRGGGCGRRRRGRRRHGRWWSGRHGEAAGERAAACGRAGTGAGRRTGARSGGGAGCGFRPAGHRSVSLRCRVRHRGGWLVQVRRDHRLRQRRLGLPDARRQLRNPFPSGRRAVGTRRRRVSICRSRRCVIRLRLLLRDLFLDQSHARQRGGGTPGLAIEKHGIDQRRGPHQLAQIHIHRLGQFLGIGRDDDHFPRLQHEARSGPAIHAHAQADFEDAVVGAGAEVQLGHGHFHHALGGFAERAEAFDVPGDHAGVGAHFSKRGAVYALDGGESDDALARSNFIARGGVARLARRHTD